MTFLRHVVSSFNAGRGTLPVSKIPFVFKKIFFIIQEGPLKSKRPAPGGRKNCPAQKNFEKQFSPLDKSQFCVIVLIA
jgi:hypothetical protein